MAILAWALWASAAFIKVLHGLRVKYGPLFTLRIGPQPIIFICSRSLAHRALVQHGAVFSDRPKALATSEILNNISSAAYGPTWRLLSRNLTSEMLHPSRSCSFSHARLSVLNTLLRCLLLNKYEPVTVVDHFQYAMFALLVLMCFGDKLDDEKIKQVEAVQRALLLSHARFDVLNFWPRLGKIVFRNRWKELEKLRKDEEEVVIPLIRARIEARKRQDSMVVYVDTLTGLQLPDEGNKSLTGGNGETAAAASGDIGHGHCSGQGGGRGKNAILKSSGSGRSKAAPAGALCAAAHGDGGGGAGRVRGAKGAQVNFTVAEMGWDPEVWEEPMSFRPERFLSDGKEVFDVTGSREIKMMPFGAGRRICPGWNLALLHLGYYVANLVWYFEWSAANGADVDLSEKLEFTVVMKHPLQAHVSPRCQVKY
ncbi:hypothetical protein RJ639_000259 [Escallonia herrerae]|uniref:Cytochrome P450 n=1 Tax=Escallonia herrerae TaxID=1293975 RepID=A0AA88XHN1_9ASTE|nr:hypothetical protein RJ639_000259 [Escallonia herrerae]